jgi:hypothetical protein
MKGESVLVDVDEWLPMLLPLLLSSSSSPLVLLVLLMLHPPFQLLRSPLLLLTLLLLHLVPLLLLLLPSPLLLLLLPSYLPQVVGAPCCGVLLGEYLSSTLGVCVYDPDPEGAKIVPSHHQQSSKNSSRRQAGSYSL